MVSRKLFLIFFLIFNSLFFEIIESCYLDSFCMIGEFIYVGVYEDDKCTQDSNAKVFCQFFFGCAIGYYAGKKFAKARHYESPLYFCGEEDTWYETPSYDGQRCRRNSGLFCISFKDGYYDSTSKKCVVCDGKLKKEVFDCDVQYTLNQPVCELACGASYCCDELKPKSYVVSISKSCFGYCDSSCEFIPWRIYASMYPAKFSESPIEPPFEPIEPPFELIPDPNYYLEYNSTYIKAIPGAPINIYSYTNLDPPANNYIITIYENNIPIKECRGDDFCGILINKTTTGRYQYYAKLEYDLRLVDVRITIAVSTNLTIDYVCTKDEHCEYLSCNGNLRASCEKNICKCRTECRLNTHCIAGYCCTDDPLGPQTGERKCVPSGTIINFKGKSYICDPPNIISPEKSEPLEKINYKTSVFKYILDFFKNILNHN